MENSPSFAALLHEVRGEPVLKVSGELDLHSAPRFKDTLEKAVASAECAGSRIPLLVVDLSETGFMDSMGLGTLIGSTQKIREGGGEVRLAVSGGEVLRVLEETGLDDALYRLPRRTVGCRRSNEAETVCDGPCTAHAFQQTRSHNRGV